MKTNQIKQRNSQFEKYFYGKIPLESAFTIFAFQKGLKQFRDANKRITNHVSVVYAFDHSTCSIIRFIVNYGSPSVEYIELDNYIDPQILLKRNHTMITRAKKWDLEYIKDINELKDGKLSTRFVTTFVKELLASKVITREPDYIFHDMRALKILFSNDFYTTDDLVDNRKLIVDYRKMGDGRSICVNIPVKFYSKRLNKDMQSPWFKDNIICRPYTSEDLGEGLKQMKRSLNARLFSNNVKFEEQISMMNKKFSNKLKDLFQGSHKKDNDIE